MTCVTSPGAPASLTACLLFVAGCFAQKVYFDCGAKVDVVDVQGLILSPGFPYNYSSGTHCVWQFVVPVDYQLVLEIFDFDVFESHDSEAQYSAFSNFEEDEEAAAEERGKVTPTGSSADGILSAAAKPAPRSTGDLLKTSRKGIPNQVVVQEQSSKMEIAKVSNSAKRSADLSSSQSSLPPSSLLLLPGAAPPADKVNNSVSASPSNENLSPTLNPSGVMEETTYGSPPSTGTPPVSPETQQSILDACPHDVLYISDLITFSSRFCGSNRPPSSQLVFGSSQEMVEVIMELITTTHWGRGFALLFHYHNLTEPGGDQQTTSPSGGRVDSLLAAVSGAAFFALMLTTVLCIIFRPKLCPKRASSCTSSNSEVTEGIQSVAAEISELQLMAENQAGPEMTGEQDNDTNQPHAVTAEGDAPQTADLELSCSGLTELDLGADEVFVVSPAACLSRLPFYPHAQRERFLRHSDTGPGPSCDWPSVDPSTSPAGARSLKESVCSRPRAWSVRTFQDFLPPLPQLHKKWCSWNSTSPFTKLVDNAPSGLIPDRKESHSRKVFSDAHLEAQANTSVVSDSSTSTASYPLTQPAQRQHRLNSTSNLRRSRFTGPCFGLLSETKDPPKGGGVPPGCVPSETGHGSSSSPSSCSSSSSSAQCHVESGKRLEFPGEGDHISVPVFAISEEEDRQPLVSAQHLERTNGPVRAKHESKRPPTGGVSPKRVRPEWRPWGSQVSGGAAPPASGAFSESGALKNGQPSVSLSTGLCSVTNHM
ncbi:uncharacterized protein LOC103141346 isoform X1 [Poecilia formosa]|uniref:uncharacterized protein LOC103141346 isoform X1 n=1 Tax=Poecilia formosa TaxID=48698 RepID=UPI0004443794|nr:PREDICTED: uncharacterized protein LOC103141346 isoform X1 [Poecilia formosa]